MSRSKLSPPWAMGVITDYCRLFGIPRKMILGDYRQSDVVRLRDEIAWCFRWAKLSYPMIGCILGKDHASVIAMIRRFNARLEKSDELRRRLRPLLDIDDGRGNSATDSKSTVFVRDRSAIQDSIATLLTGQFQFRREVSLSSFSRIDFLSGNVGIEVKIGRSLSELIHQIDRYCMYDSIQSLIVVVGSVRLSRLPSELHSKPIYTVQALRGF
jgi:hypothetical protein